MRNIVSFMTLHFITDQFNMTTDYKKTVKTPNKALRMADFDFLTKSQPRQKSAQVIQQARCSMAPPMSQAKRIAELLDEMMPPPMRCSTSKKFRNQSQIQKNYMSTSKKQIHNRKTDHAIVRRALNFIGNKVEDVQLHPKSKPINKMHLGPKYKQTGTTGINQSGNQIKEKLPINKATVPPDALKMITTDPVRRYDLRSSKKFETNFHNVEKKSIEYFQYRNVAQPFDDSICEEKSPKVMPFDKSILGLDEMSQKQADPSDSILCDMLVKTNISSPKLSQQIKLINSKICENNDLINAQMDFLNSIAQEIDRNKQKLTKCMENNKLLLEMAANLTTNNLNQVMCTADNEQVKKRPSRTSIPIPSQQAKLEKTISEEIVAKNINSTELDELNDVPKTLSGNNFEIESIPLSENKENIEIMPSRKTNYNCSLRKAVLLSTFSSNRKSIKKTPNSENTIVKPPTPKSKPSTPKDKQLSKNIRSPVTSKSLQMYKSLKDSVNFLKTPIGKKSIGSDITFETPNTRSRNITSNNIKRQLEILYDS